MPTHNLVAPINSQGHLAMTTRNNPPGPAVARRPQLFAAATAITAAGFLTVPALAQALPMLPLAPPCTQYEFTGDTNLAQSNGFVLSFFSKGPVASGLVRVSGGNEGDISGGLQGRNVDLTIRFDGGARGRYTGVVGNDGIARGTTFDETAPLSRAKWQASPPLKCATPAAPPPPQPAPAPAPAPAPQPAPAPAPAAAELGTIANGPATLQVGLSGTYVVTVSNKGGVSAPVELFIIFAGKLEQTGQIIAGGGASCELRPPDAGINAAVRCTVQQLEPGAKYDIVVQGRGSAPGAGKLLAKIGNTVNQKDITIT